MSFIWTVLLSYAELGLILALAYALFRGVRGLLQRRIDSAGMIRVARILFGVMLISPLAGHWLLSLAGRGSATTGGASGTTVDEIAALLGGLSGMFSRPLLAPESSSAASFLSQLDPTLVRGTMLTLGIALCLGLIVALAQTVARVKELRDIVREAVPHRRLGRVVIVVSDRVSVPFSTAIFGRAHVVLPVGLLQDPMLLRVTVRHELQHYRRQDPWWAVALELLRVLYFWNPAARGWTRDLSDLQELACDEAVIRRGVTAGDYGKCLLRVAEMAVAERVVASTAMATISDRGAQLRRRIDMLFDDKTRYHSRAWGLGLATFSSLLLLLIATTAAASWPAVGLFANPSVTAASAEIAASTDCSNSDCVDTEETPITAELPDLEFTDPDGSTVSLSSLEGKVVVVEFWASWCNICQREVSQMKALHERLAGEDFQMVGVSLSQTAEDTQKFIETHGVTWPQLHAEEGWNSEAGKAFAVQGVPSRFLIDRSGQVTRLPGGNPERLAARIMEALEGRQVMTATAR